MIKKPDFLAFFIGDVYLGKGLLVYWFISLLVYWWYVLDCQSTNKPVN
jgi:hypothetical protein